MKNNGNKFLSFLQLSESFPSLPYPFLIPAPLLSPSYSPPFLHHTLFISACKHNFTKIVSIISFIASLLSLSICTTLQKTLIVVMGLKLLSDWLYQWCGASSYIEWQVIALPPMECLCVPALYLWVSPAQLPWRFRRFNEIVTWGLFFTPWWFILFLKSQLNGHMAIDYSDVMTVGRVCTVLTVISCTLFTWSSAVQAIH